MTTQNQNPNGSDAPKQISPELLQMLAAMQAKAQQAQGATLGQAQARPNMTKRQEILLKAAQYIGVKMQNGIKHIDRFINFVVRPNDPDRNEVVQTARAPILFGSYVIIIFFIFGGLWAALAPIDSAAVAVGTVITSSKIQKLQFSQGGTIGAVYVKEGDHVKAGDKIIALDETQYRSQYDNTLNQYRTLAAAEARLVAERDELDVITFPEFLLKDANIPEVKKILDNQQNLFESRKQLLTLTLDRLKSEKEALVKAYASATDRARAARELFSKGFMHKAALQEAETREIDLKSRLSSVEIQLNSQKSDMMNKVLEELRTTQVQLTDAREKFNASKDSLEHTILTAPVDGIVNHLHFNTIGAVTGNNVVAEISPKNDKLVIEARVATKDIDSVRVGLKAKVRFSAYKSRTSPQFTGTVVSLSHDVVVDPQPQLAQHREAVYYSALIEIDMDEFEKFSKARGVKLQPGMGAEVQIVTGERTLLRYMLDPLTDTMFKALKEK